MGEKPNHRAARKPGPLYIIMLSGTNAAAKAKVSRPIYPTGFYTLIHLLIAACSQVNAPAKAELYSIRNLIP
jgi:hypothetical protein